MGLDARRVSVILQNTVDSLKAEYHYTLPTDADDEPLEQIEKHAESKTMSDRRLSMMSQASETTVTQPGGLRPPQKAAAQDKFSQAEQLYNELKSSIDRKEPVPEILKAARALGLFLVNTRDKQIKRHIAGKAIKLLKKMKKEPEVLFTLAEWFEQGFFGPQHVSDAFALYVSAAKKDHLESTFRAAKYYEKESGSREGRSKALRYYNKAAMQNHPGAMHRLAIVLLHGELGQKVNQREALKWLRMAVKAADNNYSQSVFSLARLHEDGLGDLAFKDPKYAMDLLHAGAELGNGDCIYRLSEIHEGGLYGIRKNQAAAFSYLEHAASLGHAEVTL
jgi:TPR repeat protein